jgi:DNA-binding LytR/AlgR family response regulator
MIRVLLVEDEPLAMRRLRRIVDEMPDVEVVGASTDGDAAASDLQRLAPDLVVLDVEMPGRSGLAVAEALSGPGAPQVVIVSAYDRYAVDAFALEAADYLLKPVRPDRLRVAVERAMRRRLEGDLYVSRHMESGGANPRLHVPGPHGGRDVPWSSILWIEAAKDYVLIHTAARTYLLRATMLEMVEQLPPAIARVHRSAFVNLAYVQRWSNPEKGVFRLTLLDGSSVPVGPTYRASLRELLRPQLD